MIGLAYEVSDDLWVTAGYGTTHFTAHAGAGDAFSRSRDGVFLQFDWFFDEDDLRRIFSSANDENQ